MSQENVEVVRQLYRVVNRDGLDAVAGFLHPDVEVVPPPNWPGSLAVRGLEQVRGFAQEWMEAFDEFQVEPERYLDPGGEQVVVYVRDRGRIKGSDAEIDARLLHVWTFTAGKIIRWEVFADETQALEAVGLAE